MGNNRVFDYTEITRIYGEMNTITGDSGDPTSIAGLLHKINEEYTEVVNGPAGEDELALKGDAASDLKNSWDNTVGDHFTKFVENFGAWSSAVAASAGDYAQFEQAVRGIKNANPLGWNSGGATDTASATGFYSNAMSEQDLADLTAQAQFYQLTGATYVDTGMVAYAKVKNIENIANSIFAIGGVVSFGATAFSMPGAVALTNMAGGNITSFGSGAGAVARYMLDPAGNTLRSLVGYTPISKLFKTAALGKVMKGAYYTGAGLGAGVLVGNAISNSTPMGYDSSKYMTGNLELPLSVGESKDINGSTYTFIGSSNSGLNIYYDSNKQMVYDDGYGNLLPVTDPTGNQATYVEGANTVINAGNDVIGPQTTLTSTFVPKSYATNYKEYNDELDNSTQQFTAWVNSANSSANNANSAAPNVSYAVPGAGYSSGGSTVPPTSSTTTNSNGSKTNGTNSNANTNNNSQGVVI